MGANSRRQIFYYSLIIVASLFFTSCASSKKLRNSNIDRVISTARSYTGTPYQWGGTSKKGMDCSGLVLTSFKSANVRLPRTVEAQSKMGKNVEMTGLKKGDILIFRIKRKGKGRVWHSGIVTNVISPEKIMFIHASSSKGVIESNLMSDYYRKSFKKARRVI